MQHSIFLRHHRFHSSSKYFRYINLKRISDEALVLRISGNKYFRCRLASNFRPDLFDERRRSLRFFSSASIHAHSNSSSENVMLNPFLSTNHGVPFKGGDNELDVAFLELFKAISILKSVPPTPLFKLNTLNQVQEKNHVDGLSSRGEEVEATANNVEKKLNNHGFLRIIGKITEQQINAEKIGSSLSHDIELAISSERYHDVLLLFEQSLLHSTTESVDDNQLSRMIRFISHQNFLGSFQILKYLATRCSSKGKVPQLQLYQRVISGFSQTKLRGKRLLDFTEDLHHHIQNTFTEGPTLAYQHILLPKLALELVKNGDPDLINVAKSILEYILEKKFPILNEALYFELLDVGSAHVGPDALPYHKILTELVIQGCKPKAQTVRNVLQSCYPFSDTSTVREILESIMNLHSHSISSLDNAKSDVALGINHSSKNTAEDYIVEMGTLEAISLMASKNANYELNLLIWDLVELFGYRPTQSMFQDIILSFCSRKSDSKSFAALKDMEKSGFVPSYGLLRQVSVRMSNNKKRLNHVRRILLWDEDHRVLSIRAMNCLLLGFGMAKDINSALDVFEDLPSCNLEPDADTYSFLIEALYIDTKHRITSAPLNSDDTNDILGLFRVIMDRMEASGIERSRHFVYEQLRLLCVLNELEDAKAVLDDAITNRKQIEMGSIFLVASKFAKNGDFATANSVANLTERAGLGKPSPSFITHIETLVKMHNFEKNSRMR